MWALPELVEAAVRGGDTGLAHGALTRLAETTQPCGTDWALGVEARCRALLSDGAAADALYREAIDRLGRTRVRPELARAHLLYGEWLRRKGRRIDAREQLRTAYDMLTAIGMEAFAERARRELVATGETVRQRSAETHHHADRAGGPHRRPGPGRPDQPGDRRPAVPVRADGPVPPGQDLHQARHHLPPRTARHADAPQAGQPAALAGQLGGRGPASAVRDEANADRSIWLVRDNRPFFFTERGSGIAPRDAASGGRAERTLSQRRSGRRRRRRRTRRGAGTGTRGPRRGRSSPLRGGSGRRAGGCSAAGSSGRCRRWPRTPAC